MVPMVVPMIIRVNGAMAVMKMMKGMGRMTLTTKFRTEKTPVSRRGFPAGWRRG